VLGGSALQGVESGPQVGVIVAEFTGAPGKAREGGSGDGAESGAGGDGLSDAAAIAFVQKAGLFEVFDGFVDLATLEFDGHEVDVRGDLRGIQDQGARELLDGVVLTAQAHERHGTVVVQVGVGVLKYFRGGILVDGVFRLAGGGERVAEVEMALVVVGLDLQRPAIGRDGFVGGVVVGVDVAEIVPADPGVGIAGHDIGPEAARVFKVCEVRGGERGRAKDGYGADRIWVRRELRPSFGQGAHGRDHSDDDPGERVVLPVIGDERVDEIVGVKDAQQREEHEGVV
jgi:hypothetical protein